MDNELLKNDLLDIANGDVNGLMNARLSYGDSWRQRGGVGAFMMLARKWDRIENQVRKHHYDVFHTAEAQGGHPDGILDDIRDLRRYLMLVEQHLTDDSGLNDNAEAGRGYVNQDFGQEL